MLKHTHEKVTNDAFNKTFLATSAARGLELAEHAAKRRRTAPK